jgi:hypothetical protein
MSDSERVATYIAWCNENNMEEVILRLSSENKGGWSRNIALDFTTKRIVVSRKSFLAKFADLGYVAGLSPYPYLLTMDNNGLSSPKIRKQASLDPNGLLMSNRFSYFVWYSDIHEFSLRKGWETMVANMVGRVIVSNFLSIKATGNRTYNFTLPVNKNGLYESILFWLTVALPITIVEK